MSTISTSTGSSAGQFSVGGLISGLDTTTIISGLLAIENQQLTDIDSKSAVIQTKQAAYKEIEARLLALQGQMTSLSRSQNGVFEARTVQVSDQNAIAAAASGSALAGAYHLRINSLAKAHQIASQGFDSLTSDITQGTLQIKVGDASTSITIDSTNDTLKGVADAINNSGAGVTANIINDGAGDGHQAYRLILTSKSTGTSNSIAITNGLGATGGGATRLIFDTGSIGAAQTTSFTGTSVVEANTGAGYTGTTNNRYTFTVINGGAVGTDDNVQLSYTDATGANTGILTLSSGDAGQLKSVAQGVQVQFAAGTLVTGDTFEVKTFVPTVQAAADASVSLGSGDGALTITNATNQIDSIIPGVALNLLASDPTKDLTITVANDVDKMKKAIQDFVSSYNDVIKDIDTQTGYNADSKRAGPLLGDRQALAVQEQIRSALANAISGINPKLNNLGALGIKSNDQGQLVIDDTKLTSALQGNVAGVTLNDIRSLFALAGSSTNSDIQFISGSTKTSASGVPITVHISQAAETASLTAANPLATSTVIDGTNNTFSISLDGKTSSTLTLAAGTYTRQGLAQAVQAAINGDSALTGRSVSVGLTGNALTITSSSYGSSSQVTAQDGTALAALGLDAAASASGRDVVGSFVVNGVTETARGSGQFLLGDSTNASTADLQIRITLTSTQVGAGLDADVTVSRGVASRLDQALTSIFDPFSGRLNTVDNGFQDALNALKDQKSRASASIDLKKQRLQSQFAAMEAALAKLQAVSGFITTQAAKTGTTSSSQSSSQ